MSVMFIPFVILVAVVVWLILSLLFNSLGERVSKVVGFFTQNLKK